jgi:hypothetical protein
MDYTPTASLITIPAPHHRRPELALEFLFESGLGSFADKSEAYLGLPAEPKDFLKLLPVAWDDTRFVAGYPGQFVIWPGRKVIRVSAGVNGIAG